MSLARDLAAAKRRPPRLRVVRPDDAEPRHAAPIYRDVARYSLEVWTYAEWARLAPFERPERPIPLLGLGYAKLAGPDISDHEWSALQELAAAAEAEADLVLEAPRKEGGRA
jgi:hypothetical protein